MQIVRIFFFYPFLFIIQTLIKRFSFVAGFALFALTLLLINEYVRDNVPSSLLGSNPNVTSVGEEISENTTNTIKVKKGDTLGAILRREKLPRKDITQIIKLAKAVKITSRLKIGQQITFEYNLNLVESGKSDLSQEKRTLARMSIAIDKIKSIDFVRQDNKFKTSNISVPLNKIVGKYESIVSSSVIASLKKTGMPTNSIVELINTYSHQIDFQRQIRSGDKITVITEKFVTPDNKLSHHGKIIHATIETRGKKHKIYRYRPNSKSPYQFFSERGHSIKSTLLRTPVNVVRISSHFGWRKKHPVLGYGKMHKGVDFAAPIGTPIYAAGSGIVTFAGWKSGYGRFVVIRHNNRLSTAYAHASRFAKRLKKGKKVKQGEIIAYVGKSGRVTGPHLHYEVRIRGKQVNPMKFKSTPGIRLAGNQLKNFKNFKQKIHHLSKKLDGGVELATTDIKEIKL